jgi:hypothetical protein
MRSLPAGIAMKKYVIRRSGTGHYVTRSHTELRDAMQAMAFSSIEEADFYRIQLDRAAEYEICELTTDGQVISVQADRLSKP